MDSWERFNETSLPPIDKFFSKLNGIGISEEDYEHAIKVWTEFNFQNLGDCHNLYLNPISTGFFYLVVALGVFSTPHP